MRAARSALSRGAAGGAAYTVAGFVQRGTPILLLPFYTRALSANEYGQVAIVVAATAVLGSLMSLGLETSVVRESVRLADDPAGHRRFLNSIGLFTLLAPAAGAIVVWGVVAAIGGLGVNLDIVLLGVLAAALQTSMTVFVGAALRAQERIRSYLALTFVHAGTTAALTLWLVVGADAGPLGWFAGALLAAAISLGFGLAILGHRWSADVSAATLRAALVFGLPLLPHALSHWVLNLSDRIVLGAFVDDAQVGAYNLAYQAAAPISLVVVAIHQGVMPLYARAAEDERVRRDLGTLATFHVHLAAWLGLAAILLGPPAIVSLFPESYAAAAGLVPWIAIGYVLFGLYVIPMDSLSLMIGRTRWLWIPTLIAACVNVGLNVLLIPRFGAFAAAVVTAVSYATLLGGVLVARARTAGPRIDYQVGPMAAGVAWMAIVGVGALIVAPALADPGAILMRLFGVVLGGLGLLFWGARASTDRPNRAVAGRPAVKRSSTDDDLLLASPNG